MRIIREEGNINSINKLYRMIIYIISLYMMCTFFSSNLANIINGSVYILYVLIIGFIMLDMRRISTIKMNTDIIKHITCFGMWSIWYMVLLSFENNTNSMTNFIGFTMHILIIAIAQTAVLYILYIYLIISKSNDMFIKITSIALTSFLINAILTIIVLKDDPNAAKIMATGNLMAAQYGLKGVAGYNIVYSLVIIVPFIVGAVKYSKGKYKIGWIVFSIIMTMYLYKSGYFTAIIATIMGVVIVLLLDSKLWVKMAISPLIIILGYFITNLKLIGSWLLSLSKVISIETISQRLYELSQWMLYGDNSGITVSGRVELYKLSVESIRNTPIVGNILANNIGFVSGHSEILDMAARMGILGLGLFGIGLYFLYKTIVKDWINTPYENMIKASFIIFLYIGTMNTFFTSLSIIYTLLFVVTGIPYLLEKMR